MPWRFVAIRALLLPAFGYFALNFADFVDGSTALTPAGLDTYAHYRDHGGSAYLTALHYRTWLDVALYAPVKIVYFLFSPLPWQVDGLTDLLAGVSGWGLVRRRLAFWTRLRIASSPSRKASDPSCLRHQRDHRIRNRRDERRCGVPASHPVRSDCPAPRRRRPHQRLVSAAPRPVVSGSH